MLCHTELGTWRWESIGTYLSCVCSINLRPARQLSFFRLDLKCIAIVTALLSYHFDNGNQPRGWFKQGRRNSWASTCCISPSLPAPAKCERMEPAIWCISPENVSYLRDFRQFSKLLLWMRPSWCSEGLKGADIIRQTSRLGRYPKWAHLIHDHCLEIYRTQGSVAKALAERND